MQEPVLWIKIETREFELGRLSENTISFISTEEFVSLEIMDIMEIQ